MPCLLTAPGDLDVDTAAGQVEGVQLLHHGHDEDRRPHDDLLPGQVADLGAISGRGWRDPYAR